MKSIPITARARLGLLALINQQQGSFGEIAQLFDIREKIKFPEDEQNRLIKQHPQGMMLNLPAISDYPNKPIEFEKAEIEKIKSLIEGCKTFSVDDAEWLTQLQNSLKES